MNPIQPKVIATEMAQPSTFAPRIPVISCHSSLQMAASKDCFQKIKDWILGLWTSFKHCFETKKTPIQPIDPSPPLFRQESVVQPEPAEEPFAQLPAILEPIAQAQTAPEPIAQPGPAPEPAIEAPPANPLGDQLWNTIDAETNNVLHLSRRLEIIIRKLDSLPFAFSSQQMQFQENDPYSGESTHAKNSMLVLRSITYSFITQFETEMDQMQQSFKIAKSALGDAEAAMLDVELIARMRAAVNTANVVGIHLFHFASSLDNTINNYLTNAEATFARIPENFVDAREAEAALNNIRELEEVDMTDRAGEIWRGRDQITDETEIEQLHLICQELLRNKNRVAEWDKQISTIWVRADRAVNEYREPTDRPDATSIPPLVPIPGPDPAAPIEHPAYVMAIEEALELQERRRNLEALLPRLADEVGIARQHYSCATDVRNRQIHSERFHILVHAQINHCRFLMKQLIDDCNRTEESAAIQEVPPELRDARWEAADRQNPQNAQDIFLITIVAMNHMIEMYDASADLTCEIIARHFNTPQHVDVAGGLANDISLSLFSAGNIKARALGFREHNNWNELLRAYDEISQLLAQTEGNVRHLEDKWYVAANVNRRDANESDVEEED